MPKKRSSRTLRVKPTAQAHPSLQSTHHETARAKSERSVNEMLSRMRRVQVSPVGPASYLPPARLPPPSPPSASPTEADAALTPRELMARRRAARPPPGPRPPPSWTSAGRGVAERDTLHTHNDMVPQHSTQESMLPDHRPLPGIEVIPRRSLRRTCMNTMVRLWPSLDEVDIETIGVNLPPQLREYLLLELAEQEVWVSHRTVHLLAAGTASEHPRPSDLLPESWEDASEPEASPVMRLTLRGWSHVRLPALHFLTALSLACSPTHDWNRLLDALPSLAHLTHLDLSHWRMDTDPFRPRINGMYSSEAAARNTARYVEWFESPSSHLKRHVDWSEAARILRQIGGSLGGLQWLSLEGCAGWMLLWPNIADAEAAVRERLESPMNPASPRNTAPPGHSSRWDVEAHQAAQGSNAWPEHFPRLRTLRLSPRAGPELRAALADHQAFQRLADRYPSADRAARAEPFPPTRGDALLRVPDADPDAPLPRDYEGPRWLVFGGRGAAPRSAYTLQPARQVDMWVSLATWLDANLDLKMLERSANRHRAAAGLQALAVERAGVDDGEPWLRDLLWRWQRKW